MRTDKSTYWRDSARFFEPALTRAWGNRVCFLAFAVALLLSLASLTVSAI